MGTPFDNLNILYTSSLLTLDGMLKYKDCRRVCHVNYEKYEEKHEKSLKMT